MRTGWAFKPISPLHCSADRCSGQRVGAEVIVEEFFIVEAGLFTLGEAVVADADFVGANFGAGGATVGHGGSPKGRWRREGPFPSQGFQTADWQKGMQ